MYELYDVLHRANTPVGEMYEHRVSRSIVRLLWGHPDLPRDERLHRMIAHWQRLRKLNDMLVGRDTVDLNTVTHYVPELGISLRGECWDTGDSLYPDAAGVWALSHLLLEPASSTIGRNYMELRGDADRQVMVFPVRESLGTRGGLCLHELDVEPLPHRVDLRLGSRRVHLDRFRELILGLRPRIDQEMSPAERYAAGLDGEPIAARQTQGHVYDPTRPIPDAIRRLVSSPTQRHVLDLLVQLYVSPRALYCEGELWLAVRPHELASERDRESCSPAAIKKAMQRMTQQGLLDRRSRGSGRTALHRPALHVIEEVSR